MEQYVWVVRQKGDWQKGKVRLLDLQNVHWDNISGGAQIKAGMYGLYGYIYCNQIVEGVIGHSGIHGPCPHNIKIHIQKCDNSADIYKELVAKAGDKPTDTWRGHDVAEQIREIVREQPGILATEVVNLMESSEISKKMIQNGIRYLKKKEFKNKESLHSEKCGITQKLYIKENGYYGSKFD